MFGRVFLVYDNMLPSSVSKVETALGESIRPNRGVISLSLSAVDSNTFSRLAEDEVLVVVILSHGNLIIDEETRRVTYFENGIDNLIDNIRNIANFIWIAGCFTRNIDTSKVLSYSEILREQESGKLARATIQPFAFSDGNADCPKVITVNWLVRLLCILKENKYDNWWTLDEHPLLRHDALTIQSIIGELFESVYCGNEDDEVLFPNTLTFPEIFHGGVVVACLLDKSLQMYDGEKALEAYVERYFGQESVMRKKAKWAKTDDAKRRSIFIDSGLAKSANDWFNQICTASNEKSPQRNNDIDIIIYKFQSCLISQISMKKVKEDYAIDLSSSDLVRRLLCYNDQAATVPQTTTTPPSIALVFRVKQVETGREDIRMCAKSDVFKGFVLKVLQKCKTSGIRVVLMDGVAWSTEDPELDIYKDLADRSGCPYIDARRHHDRNTWPPKYLEKCESTRNSVLDQLRYVHWCVQTYNIQGAFGIHGGFLDIINAFGVPVQNTVRFFSTGSRNDVSHWIEHWIERTDDFLNLFSCGKSIWIQDFSESDTAITSVLENV